MSEFCVKCVEKETQIELLNKQIYNLKQLLQDLSETEQLPQIINLSCDGK